MGEVKKVNIKNRTYYFHNDMIISKTLSQTCSKLTGNHTKTLVFTTFDILQLKQLTILKTLTA